MKVFTFKLLAILVGIAYAGGLSPAEARSAAGSDISASEQLAITTTITVLKTAAASVTIPSPLATELATYTTLLVNSVDPSSPLTISEAPTFSSSQVTCQSTVIQNTTVVHTITSNTTVKPPQTSGQTTSKGRSSTGTSSGKAQPTSDQTHASSHIVSATSSPTSSSSATSTSSSHSESASASATESASMASSIFVSQAWKGIGAAVMVLWANENIPSPLRLMVLLLSQFPSNVAAQDEIRGPIKARTTPTTTRAPDLLPSSTFLLAPPPPSIVSTPEPATLGAPTSPSTVPSAAAISESVTSPLPAGATEPAGMMTTVTDFMSTATEIMIVTRNVSTTVTVHPPQPKTTSPKAVPSSSTVKKTASSTFNTVQSASSNTSVPTGGTIVFTTDSGSSESEDDDTKESSAGLMQIPWTLIGGGTAFALFGEAAWPFIGLSMVEYVTADNIPSRVAPSFLDDDDLDFLDEDSEASLAKRAKPTKKPKAPSKPRPKKPKPKKKEDPCPTNPQRKLKDLDCPCPDEQKRINGSPLPFSDQICKCTRNATINAMDDNCLCENGKCAVNNGTDESAAMPALGHVPWGLLSSGALAVAFGPELLLALVLAFAGEAVAQKTVSTIFVSNGQPGSGDEPTAHTGEDLEMESCSEDGLGKQHGHWFHAAFLGMFSLSGLLTFVLGVFVGFWVTGGRSVGIRI